MRYNFKWSGEYVKLRDEIRHIENYIEVMNIRFDEPIELKLEIPNHDMDMEMLKMSLQPIVENAVKHAWTGEEAGPRSISIEVRDLPDNDVRIVVTDNGRGMDEAALTELNLGLENVSSADKVTRGFGFGPEPKPHGIGLRNVQERIRLYYGKDYGLHVYSEEGQFTRVVMKLPKVLLTGRGGTDDQTDNRG